MKVRTIALALILMLTPRACLAEQEHYTARTKVTTDYFSTASTLLLYDDFSLPERRQAFDETWDDVKALLDDIDKALSATLPDSDVCRFNALAPNASVTISEHTQSVLETAREVYELSRGAYDPTVSTLVDMWGFSPGLTPRGVLPDARYIEKLRALAVLPSVRFIDGAITKEAPSVSLAGVEYVQTLDLGGIGKGYAVDKVTALLRERGYRYGYFSCGASSLAVLNRVIASAGAPKPEQWGVAIKKPRYASRGEDVFMRVFTANNALSTSGDYEHAYMVNDVRYCHLIDPGTGYPINMPVSGAQRGICSASVFGANAALDDALSTALCVMGLKPALALMNSDTMQGRMFVLVLYNDAYEYCEYVTNIPEADYVVLDDSHYVLASRMEAGKVIYTGTLLN